MRFRQVIMPSGPGIFVTRYIKSKLINYPSYRRCLRKKTSGFGAREKKLPKKTPRRKYVCDKRYEKKSSPKNAAKKSCPKKRSEENIPSYIYYYSIYRDCKMFPVAFINSISLQKGY